MNRETRIKFLKEIIDNEGTCYPLCTKKLYNINEKCYGCPIKSEIIVCTKVGALRISKKLFAEFTKEEIFEALL